MKILVCVKQVPDTETKVKIAGDGKTMDESDVNFILNPYCEFAVEEALKVQESLGGEVCLLTVGPSGAKTALRSGLAMGADTAVHLVTDAPRISDAFVIAKALADEIKNQAPDLVFMGKKSVDADMSAVPAMTAALLDMPIATSVNAAEYSDGKITVKRDSEDGQEKFELAFPCIVTTDKGLNTPRYASLKGIMKAKKKPVEEKEIQLEDAKSSINGMTYPAVSAAGKIVGNGADAVPELIRLLREEAKVME